MATRAPQILGRTDETRIAWPGLQAGDFGEAIEMPFRRAAVHADGNFAGARVVLDTDRGPIFATAEATDEDGTIVKAMARRVRPRVVGGGSKTLLRIRIVVSTSTGALDAND